MIEYTTTEKIGMLYDMSIKEHENRGWKFDYFNILYNFCIYNYGFSSIFYLGSNNKIGEDKMEEIMSNGALGQIFGMKGISSLLVICAIIAVPLIILSLKNKE